MMANPGYLVEEAENEYGLNMGVVSLPAAWLI
jgi:hypothetical protein